MAVGIKVLSRFLFGFRGKSGRPEVLNGAFMIKHIVFRANVKPFTKTLCSFLVLRTVLSPARLLAKIGVKQYEKHSLSRVPWPARSEWVLCHTD